jgi:hypothetical protein
VERDDLAPRHRGVLGVAAVEGAAHAAHHGGPLLTGSQDAVRVEVDGAGRLDAEDPGEGDAFGQAEAGVQFGAVQAERLDLDPHPAAGGSGIGRSTRRNRSTGPGPSRTTARMVPLI